LGRDVIVLAELSSELLKLWLRLIWSQVPTTYATLSAGLLAEAQAKLAAVSGGAIQMTSANGATVQFFGAEGTQATPQDWAQGGSRLLDLYDEVLEVLVNSGVASPTDAQVYTEMAWRLTPARRAQTNFAGIRN
jgi:hypothetical protein